ncbi:MAG: hypothetical protein H6570_01920 [Lewinellaceae bacterium]|nr:hypothetical protein [Lewinellaceae bacterium]
MSFKPIFLLIMMFSGLQAAGQNPFLDSLKTTLPYTTSDTQRLRILNTLAQRGFALDARQSIDFATEAQSLAENSWTHWLSLKLIIIGQLVITLAA